MNKPFIADQTFKGKDYRTDRLSKGEYENCIFENCDFSEGYLDNQHFMECQFLDCNLSNTNLGQTVLNDVHFTRCKMMGVKFENCNDFLMSFGFSNCVLNFSSFYKMALGAIQFDDCKLIEVDFTETDLSGASLDECDLEKAIFYDTVLEKTDLTTAYNFSIDPERNQIKKAKFSKANIVGLLTKYNIVIEN
ncbi:pentapeptide repeat-containing protein [Maribacter sp. ANRC-HE7]|uniref:Pentapeptide repeat-containing protein n=1 Tax=Maribacter aquimaris TaxID=2737171 RepID=A0ABR7V4E9_9FLAO|nr:pentapeptide repeat-containing protein [Maribacter aquimaris]MBD0779245.1 pentapeptide repeat-containing protein [Maribacter aquimaris]